MFQNFSLDNRNYLVFRISVYQLSVHRADEPFARSQSVSVDFQGISET